MRQRAGSLGDDNIADQQRLTLGAALRGGVGALLAAAEGAAEARELGTHEARDRARALIGDDGDTLGVAGKVDLVGPHHQFRLAALAYLREKAERRLLLPALAGLNQIVVVRLRDLDELFEHGELALKGLILLRGAEANRIGDLLLAPRHGLVDAKGDSLGEECLGRRVDIEHGHAIPAAHGRAKSQDARHGWGCDGVAKAALELDPTYRYKFDLLPCIPAATRARASSNMPDAEFTPPPKVTLVAVGGFDGSRDLPSVETCTPSSNQPAAWTILQGEMQTVRSAAGAAAWGSRVFVAGGSSGRLAHSAVESFTVVSDDGGATFPGDAESVDTCGQCQWRSEPSLACARMATSLAATQDGTLFAVGGYTHELGSLNVVESLTPGALEWQRAPDLLAPRCSFGCVELGGAVIALGGFGDDNRGALTECELLDRRTSGWQMMPPMMQRRSCCSAAPIDAHRVLVCGGHDGTRALAEAEIYDMVADKWMSIPPMPTARSGLATVADAEARVWALGGYPDGTAAHSAMHALSVVEVFHDAAGCWSSEAVMRCGRTGAGAVALPA